MNELQVRHYGAGPDIVLLHGWGMHGGVWEGTVEALAGDWRVTVIDLPGHGANRPLPLGRDLRALAAGVAAVAPERAAWLGWSLGGLVATRLALDAPGRVVRLLLVGANACFAQRPDWPHAMAAATLAAFATSLARDWRATLKRFLALEVLDSDRAAEQLREFRRIVFDGGAEPDPAALVDGLALLETEDLRAELPRLACPVRLLLGRRDNLVPVDAGPALLPRLADGKLHVFERSAHAPFLSHPEAFAAQLKVFLHD